MKTPREILILLVGLLAGTSAFAGDLWEWAPGHYTYTDNHGRVSNGWTWAPGHTTWTDSCGHTRNVWEWAPGHFSVTGD
jgi:hypothetical protein